MFPGRETGMSAKPSDFSLLVSEVADFGRENGKRDIKLFPGLKEIVLLLFADDIVLLSSTPSGLRNQIDSL